MDFRKPWRLNEGFFGKHQPHSYQRPKYTSSKHDYGRDRTTNYRGRDLSPIVGGSLNNGNSSYGFHPPEMKSSSSRGHGGSHHIRERTDHRGRGHHHTQKMRDRGWDLYKKNKYLSDKRDRRNDRDFESHRRNRDRIDRRNSMGVKDKLSSSSSAEKRSKDRDLDRMDRYRDKSENKRDCDRGRCRDRKSERYRDRNKRSGDRESYRRNGGAGSLSGRKERGERVARYGDWSEHVSSSGTMYYYNCETEVSQWKKPKEWIERERNLTRDQHREKYYREKDRERDQEDHFSRSPYPKHSNCRGISRQRWNNYDNDNGPPNTRRRLDAGLAGSIDNDINSGDSTAMSEASYPLQGTPTAHAGGNQHNDHCATPLSSGSLPNAFPRLASHPNVNNLSISSTLASGTVDFLYSPAATASGTGVAVGDATMLLSTGLASTSTSATAPQLSGGGNAQTQICNHKKLDSEVQQSLGRMGSPIAAGTVNQLDHHVNSNTLGPPKLGTKESQDLMFDSQPQKNFLHMPQLGSEQPPGSTGSSIDVYSSSTEPHGMISPSESAIDSPLYNMTHSHIMSDVTSPVISVSSGSSICHNNNSSSVKGTVNSGCVSPSYFSNSQLGLKTVEGGNRFTKRIGNSSLFPSTGSTNIAATASAGCGLGTIPGEGPPTSTLELDVSGLWTKQQPQRKNENSSSASLSTSQSCEATSAPVVCSQGPDIQAKFSKYFRPDLITHATNWQAESYERQAQKIAHERYSIIDPLYSKSCLELKRARSVLKIHEINAELQERRLLHLRERIKLLEDQKMDTLSPADTP